MQQLMASPRPVRIARSSRRAGAPPSVAPESPAAAWVPNRAGEARAARLFGLFALVLGALYALFLGLSESNSHPGVAAAPVAWAVFTVLAVLLGLWGWSITYGRTPRSAQRRAEEILVRERLGRIRRFPRSSAASPRVLQRYDAGFLGPSDTVLAEIEDRDNGRRAYLVGSAYFETLAVA